MAIRYLENQDIDAIAWNKCIETSVNGNIFAYSWYLDIVAPNWEALVEDDYKSVMPITYEFLLGSKLLSLAKFSFSLGIFTNKPLDSSLSERFFAAIPVEYREVKFPLNKFNKINDELPLVEGKKIMFELDLIRRYEIIRSKYHIWLVKTIQKSEQNDINIISGLQGNELVGLHSRNARYSMHSVNESDSKILKILISLILRSNSGEVVGAYNKNNQLQAVALFVYSHSNVHLLFYAQTREGYKAKLMYSITDFFIKKHSEKNLTLSIFPKGRLARYFDLKLFGAQTTEFYNIYINRLPWYLKHVSKKLGSLKNFI